MALIVEDGTKVAGANSYISAADATTYHATYGNTDWPTDVPTQEQALIIATQACDALWGAQYESFRLQGTQNLLWPRYQYYDRYLQLRPQTQIPTELKNAVCEMALLYCNGTDLFPQEFKEANLISESTKIGDIQINNTYLKPTNYTIFRKVELLMYPILRNKRGPVNLAR